MSDNNKKKKKKNRFTFGKGLKIFLITLSILVLLSGGALAGMVISIIKDAPEIDPRQVNASLAHTSYIYDSQGNLIEKVEAAEFRTYVTLDQMPQHLKDAFIAIEDERFYEHHGIDPRGIIASMVDNIKAGGIVRGASTITQQLVKNVYLSPDKLWSRKIQEAYLALQMERVLHKDQILEAYLNRNFFGQNAYGVQEAAQTYFSKDVGDLTIAESAMLAGIIKSTSAYQPYIRVSPENYDANLHYKVGEADILGQKYILVFNPKSVERQKIVLSQMLKLGMITEEEYEEALAVDMKTVLKPGKKKISDITSYFTDYVKTETVNLLMEKLGYSKEQAEEELFTGGLHIYTTIDVEMQRELEEVYDNFVEILIGNTANVKGPVLVDWNVNRSGDVIDERGNLIYYKESNLLNEDYDLVIENGTYEVLENGDIKIKNKKLTIYPKHIDIADYYRIDEKKNLVTHTVGSIIIPEDEFSVGENKELIISKKYLDKNEGFYRIDENNNLIISNSYFYRDPYGLVQPQSASVIIDYRTGHIKAIVGGRDVDGNRILNRATDSRRQPGSTIKPLSAYLPALDNGFTAASPIDDIPYYSNGVLWPRNWYKGYRGINSLRKSLEQSINVNAVKMVEAVGVKTAMSYLEKLGIIDPENPGADSFVTASENSSTNDENLSALALGGMTKGLTPLEITAAYGAIANDGVYVEPICITKIYDKDGNLLIENTPKKTTVVSPQVAYIMGDIMRTTVSEGLAGRARLSNMAVAGKTGTTQHNADIWFVGYTPYYVSGVWIGNDSPKITLARSSSTAAQLWQHINTKIHEGLESKTSFNRPEGIVTANVCTQSGKLPTPLCTQDPRHVVRSEIFAPGTVPKEYCDVHVEVTIDTSTGKIANEYCPDDLVETRVFIQRTPPYNPADHNGITPADFQYSAPTEVCDEHNEETAIRDELEDLFQWPWDWWNNGDDDNNSGNNSHNNGNGNENGNSNSNSNGNGNGNGRNNGGRNGNGNGNGRNDGQNGNNEDSINVNGNNLNPNNN
ncbi:MAG: PBP1A family penicillin-binding protein [Tissierellia bacterium]|nr:PBP1A family penicillin-binding protein [Tissierellia bacterium]